MSIWESRGRSFVVLGSLGAGSSVVWEAARVGVAAGVAAASPPGFAAFAGLLLTRKGVARPRAGRGGAGTSFKVSRVLACSDDESVVGSVVETATSAISWLSLLVARSSSLSSIGKAGGRLGQHERARPVVGGAVVRAALLHSLRPPLCRLGNAWNRSRATREGWKLVERGGVGPRAQAVRCGVVALAASAQRIALLGGVTKNAALSTPGLFALALLWPCCPHLEHTLFTPLYSHWTLSPRTCRRLGTGFVISIFTRQFPVSTKGKPLKAIYCTLLTLP